MKMCFVDRIKALVVSSDPPKYRTPGRRTRIFQTLIILFVFVCQPRQGYVFLGVAGPHKYAENTKTATKQLEYSKAWEET